MRRRSDSDEPVIGVSIERGQVVIRLCGRLDDAAVDAVRELLDGARAAGHAAVVEFDGCELADQAALSTSASAGR
jgi:hypothetical protein